MSAKKILYVETRSVDTSDRTCALFILTSWDIAMDADAVLCF